MRDAAPGQVSTRWQARQHDDLSRLEATWRQAETNGWSTAFQRFDWMTTLIRSVARARKVECFVIEVADRAGRPALLIPFARERRWGLSVLTIVDFELCDYLAPVLLPGADPLPAPAELWAVIRAALPRADLVLIPKMPPAIAGRANPLLGLPVVSEMAMKQYGLAIGPPASDAVQRATRPSTFRDLAKYKRRLAKAGEVRFVLATTEEDADAIASAMMAQRRARFREMGRENLMDLPEFRRFYRDAARNGLAGGPARVFGLSVDGEWVGTSYGLVHGKEFALVAQTMAGGPWQKFSPGILASAATMEWAVEQGMTYFDFTVGFMPYKIDLGATEGPLFELTDTLTARGALTLATVRRTRRLKDATQAFLRRFPRVYAPLRAARRQLRRMAGGKPD